ncbi:MAG: DedA family protein [Candidatus Wildermuthbacteria bacterium]|nr:DedA family protein [Candidatus Wildermuthbacteria bacterium]
MALESANIPVPSEIIMPFSGFLAWKGTFVFWIVVFFGALGNVLGSLFSYYLGFWGGRRFFEKYGRYLFITRHDLELSERLFRKYGAVTVFVARLLPVVRTFISFPAGMAKMNLGKFLIYTSLGSFFWSALLAFLGLKAGENWTNVEIYFRRFDWLIIGILLLLGVWWIWRHVKIIHNENSK